MLPTGAVPLLLLLLISIGLCSGFPHSQLLRGKEGRKASWLAGSSTGVITPPVNGTVDYVRPVDEYDESSPGTFVLQFDQGDIPIGNGARDSHWVHDHVQTSVIALRGTNNVTLVVVSTDLYMLFGPDIEMYKTRLLRRIGQEAFSELRFLVSSTHNHHGPDTSGLSLNLNRDWFSYMIDVTVDVTNDALKKLQPVTLTVSDSDWQFGQGDIRDPRLVDPTLNVLQARSIADGSVVATLVQWAFHPEGTLGFNPTIPEADCIALGEGPGCTGNGRYISADFPGHLRNYLLKEYGTGDVIYINGPLGNQIGAHGPVWEVSPEFPITGDGSVAPPGAILLPKNFRKTLLIGRELAGAVVRSLVNARARQVEVSQIDFISLETYTRVNNILFLAGFAPKYLRPNQPLVIGYNLRDLYICTQGVPPSAETCQFDNYETYELAGFGLPIRKGNFAKANLNFVKFDRLTILTIPGELAPEIANGLPADFDDPASVSKYYQNPQFHRTGADYILPGVLKDMVRCDYCWVFGLTTDAAGYIFPSSDWRISCTGSFCDGEGFIEGETCKKILETGSEEGKLSCLFGQVSQYEDHYEETISTSWDIAGDVVNGYSKLLGVPPSGRFTKDDWTQ